MSKAIGKILAVASVVVGVLAAIPSGGTSLLVALAGSAGNAAILGAVLAVASLVNSLALAGQQSETNQQRQAAATSLQLGEGPRAAIFGRAAVGGTLTDAFDYGGEYSTDWEVLVLTLADHRCDALESVYVNDQVVPFAGDGAVAGYGGQLEVYWRDGREDQSPPAVLTAQGGWSADDRLRGVAYVTVAYKADDPNAETPVWTAGRPQFLWVVRGLRLYDPRKDSTVPGGSGAHRWADPATREWGENAELCRYNYDRGIFACDRVTDPGMLLIGRGLSSDEAPPARIFAAANVCDEVVPALGAATEARYRVGGVIYANEGFGDVAEAFGAAMGGVVIQPEGTVAVEPGQAKAPTFAFIDADIVSGTKVGFSSFRTEADKEWINTVAPRYVEPAQKWADHGAPVRRIDADVVADKGPREATPSLRLVTSGTQAQRVGEILRRQGRLLKTATVTLGPRFAEIEEGDWGVWTSARRLGGVATTFRVESFSLGRDWRITLTLREMAASVYAAPALIADGAVAAQQTPVTAPYYQPPRAAHALVSRTPSYPWSSDASSITIAAFSGVLDDTRTIAFPARTFTGLTAGTAYALFWSLTASAYQLVLASASAGPIALDTNVQIISLYTAAGDGTYPGDDVPPGTRGGGGGVQP